MSANNQTWSREAVKVLQSECWVRDTASLKASLAWWKRMRARGYSDGDITAALQGVQKVTRIGKPFYPFKLFKPENFPLFQEAMSAGRKSSERKPQSLKAIFARIARD